MSCCVTNAFYCKKPVKSLSSMLRVRFVHSLFSCSRVCSRIAARCWNENPRMQAFCNKVCPCKFGLPVSPAFLFQNLREFLSLFVHKFEIASGKCFLLKIKLKKKERNCSAFSTSSVTKAWLLAMAKLRTLGSPIFDVLVCSAWGKHFFFIKIISDSSESLPSYIGHTDGIWCQKMQKKCRTLSRNPFFWFRIFVILQSSSILSSLLLSSFRASFIWSSSFFLLISHFFASLTATRCLDLKSAFLLWKFPASTLRLKSRTRLTLREERLTVR